MKTSDIVAAQQSATRINARAEVRDIRLLKSSLEAFSMPASGSPLAYDLDSDPEIQYSPGDNFFVAQFHYRLDIVQQSTEESGEEASPEEIAHIEFSLGALFSLDMRENDDPVEEDELLEFGKSTAHLVLYPYAREYIHSSTARMGLPPLSVGVMKLAADPPPAK